MTAFSQNAIKINKDSIVCLPIHTARLVAADLLQYDLCREELSTTQQLVRLLEEKDSTQTVMFAEKEKQYNACRSQVDALNEQVDLYKKINGDLTSTNNKLKTTNIILGTTTGAAILTTVLVFLLK